MKLILAASIFLSTNAFALGSAPAPSGTFIIGGVKFHVVMQAPHLMKAPMQTFGVFNFREKGDGFSGADLEMDEAFGGAVQELRKAHGLGKLGEWILLDAPKDKTGAPKILLMGLGSAEDFKVADMARVGSADIRVACAQKLRAFSHASDVQDGGVSLPAGEIAEAVVHGMVEELATQDFLAAKGLNAKCGVKEISYLAGPKFLKDTLASFAKLAKEIGPGR